MPTNPSELAAACPNPAGPASQDRAGQTPLAALWRTREYLRPYYGKLALMLAAAIGAAGAMIAIPLLIKAVIDGPIEQGTPARCSPWAWPRSRSAVLRPRAEPVPAVDTGQRGHRHGAVDAGQLLRASAAAARRVPRRVAVRPAAVPGHHRPVRDPAVRRVRHRLLHHQRGDLHRGHRAADPAELVARPADRVRLPARGGALHPLRAGGTGCCHGAPRTRRATWPRTWRRPQPASACSRRSAAATRRPPGTPPRPRWCGPRRYRRPGCAAPSRPAFDLVPNAVIGLILLLGALAVSRDELTLGGLVAFIALALQLVWPIEAMGYILSSGQEAATAAQRIYETFDTEPGDRTDPRRAPAGPRAPRPQGGLASTA